MRGRNPSTVQGRDRRRAVFRPFWMSLKIRDRPQAINPGVWGRAPFQRRRSLLISFPAPACAPAREFEND
jgi:hypothetical protein